MLLFFCCTLNVSDGRGTKIFWNWSLFLWVIPVNSTDVSFSCPIHHAFISTRSYNKTHTFTRKSTHTQTLIWFHFLQPGMSVTSTDTPEETLQATARSSFYLKGVFFISSPLHLISSIYCSQTRSDWFLPNLMPQAATERPNTNRFL